MAAGIFSWLFPKSENKLFTVAKKRKSTISFEYMESTHKRRHSMNGSEASHPPQQQPLQQQQQNHYHNQTCHQPTTPVAEPNTRQQLQQHHHHQQQQQQQRYSTPQQHQQQQQQQLTTPTQQQQQQHFNISFRRASPASTSKSSLLRYISLDERPTVYTPTHTIYSSTYTPRDDTTTTTPIANNATTTTTTAAASDVELVERGFKLLSLDSLREKATIYKLDRHLETDRLASWANATLLTEFTDTFARELVDELVQEREYEEVVEQLAVELLEEIVREEKELVALLPEEKELVHRVLHDRHADDDEILVKAFNVDMTRRLMLCLRDAEWLNDEIINFYMNLLDARCQSDSQRYPRCFFFNTFFYHKLTQGGTYKYANVKRWTKKVDVFSLDKIVVPVHLGVHWTLAVVNLRDKRFEYYDSMGASNDYCLRNLARWLDDESRDKKGSGFDSQQLGFQYHQPKSIPQQRNSWDCGVFTCKFANAVSQDQDKPTFRFSQQDMKYFRQRMVVEILNKRVL